MPPKDRLRLNDLGRTESACFAGSHSPRPPPLAPPTPQPVARLCSQLLLRSLTSHVRSSSATAPRLPDAGQSGHRSWPDVGSPGSRPRSFCTCQVLRPRRAVRTLRWCVRNVLPSALETASAPGSSLYRG